MSLVERLGEAALLVTEDSKSEGAELLWAFKTSLDARTHDPLTIQQALQIVLYWTEVAAGRRRTSEDEDEEEEFRQAEALLRAAANGLEKALMSVMHTAKMERFST